MKFAAILNLLIAAVTLAAPTQQPADDERNDVVEGSCKPVTVIFARGTDESGSCPCRFPTDSPLTKIETKAMSGAELDPHSLTLSWTYWETTP
jgi:hypothetical protein